MDLPSKDYFLKLLDRPHYAYEQDVDGNELKDRPLEPAQAKPQPVKPQRQVSNDVPRLAAP